MQITFQRMRKNCLRQDNDWNELLEHYVRIIVVKFRISLKLFSAYFDQQLFWKSQPSTFNFLGNPFL